VEAWALGTPVVSGDFPGVGDVVHDGVDGVVAGTEPRELAAVLAAVLRDGPRRADLAAAGRRRAAGLTWLVVVDQVAAGYRAALRRAPAGADAP
jgi:phosphatidylinositol alpha-mannosyltransferase